MNPMGTCALYVSACGTIEHTSESAPALLGMELRALEGQLLLNRFDAPSRQRLRELWLSCDDSAGHELPLWRPGLTVLRADGSWVPTCATARASADDEPGHIVVELTPLVGKPLHDKVQAPESLHDALTGLPNRRGAREVIDAALAIGAKMEQTLSVACIDIDNFRSVNEGYGHDVAESVLRSLGARLHAVVQGGCRVCRTAGDEFLVIRRGADSAEQMRALIPRLMSCLQQPLEIAGQTLIVTASIGIATHDCRGTDFDTLMRRASHAMSRAKRLGRNTWYFAASDAAPSLRQQAIKTRLYRAIEQGDLELHYQPIVDLRTGAVRSLEALMRWNDEQLGPVSPVVFIPLAEESGLMAPLGAWALQEACRQSRAWRRDLRLPCPIAVNISAVQLQRGEFEQDLRQLLEAGTLGPGMIELEVTESALIHDGAHLAEMSRRLQALGIGVAVDDFGTGYSNLLYLKHFHPSKIKIDRSFVHELATQSEDRAIVRAVIDMAHAIGAKVVAEGVETPEVGDVLLRLGCDEAQGYLYARPAPAARVDDWLRRHLEPAGRTPVAACGADASGRPPAFPSTRVNARA